MDRYRKFAQENPLSLASIVTVIVVLPAVLSWLQYAADFSGSLSVYVVFPLFGLLAFTLMIAHVLVGAAGMLSGLDMRKLQRYYTYTSVVVLAGILLHPGLFVWQLYQDGYGLPPNSYLQYVEPSLRGFVLLGVISFVIFLIYEFKRVYGKSSWWHYIERASDLALVLVFVHGLFLGSNTQAGWFRVVWVMYGVTLISCLIYAHYRRHAQTTTS